MKSLALIYQAFSVFIQLYFIGFIKIYFYEKYKNIYLQKLKFTKMKKQKKEEKAKTYFIAEKNINNPLVDIFPNIGCVNTIFQGENFNETLKILFENNNDYVMWEQVQGESIIILVGDKDTLKNITFTDKSIETEFPAENVCSENSLNETTTKESLKLYPREGLSRFEEDYLETYKTDMFEKISFAIKGLIHQQNYVNNKTLEKVKDSTGIKNNRFYKLFAFVDDKKALFSDLSIQEGFSLLAYYDNQQLKDSNQLQLFPEL